MLADISNEIEEAEVFEPIVVVDYARCIGAFKVEKARELGLLTVEVVLENFKIQELAFGCFSTGVAYHACCTANERDRTVTRTLQVDQEHYWYKVANVQRVCSGVKSHIAGGLLFAQVLFEARHGVVQHAAPLEFRYEIHGCKGTIEGGEPKALKSSNELFELHGPRALEQDSPALNWMGRKVILERAQLSKRQVGFGEFFELGPHDPTLQVDFATDIANETVPGGSVLSEFHHVTQNGQRFGVL